jgi:hypothetical protein
VKKLPKLQIRPVPEWQKARLARWIREWRIEQDLASAGHTHGDRGPALRLATGVSTVSDREPSLVSLVADVSAEPRPEEGQIRLLSPDICPDSCLPLYVAVLRLWDDDSFLIAPYGRFSEPGTTGELLTGRDAPSLRVLSLWNVHTVSRTALLRSWFIDCLSAVEMADAWEVFRHVALGADLQTPLLERTGPPILRPDDPRIQYQNEELRRMASLARLDERLQVISDDGDAAAAAAPAPDEHILVFVPWVSMYEEERQLAMVAESHAIYGAETVFQVSGRDLHVHVTPHSNWRDYVCLVTDIREEPVESLDGYCVMSGTGRISEPIAGGQVIVEAEILRGGFSLSDTAGNRVKLEPIK